MKPIGSLFLIIIVLNLFQCATNNESTTTINYPEPKPDSAALRFLPGIVSTDSLDFNSAFSIDGKSFYFAHTVKGKFVIYQTIFDGSNWSMPAHAAFSDTNYSEADPFITDDGSIYYISNRPRDASDTIPDFDIWVVRPQPNGGWSALENLQAINSDSTEYYVSLSANGNIYFASNRSGGYGSHDIYYSKFVDGKYTTPENLGPSVNSAETEHDPLIAKDERFIVFTAVNRKDGYGEADLYYSLKDENKKWAQALNMGKQINTPTYEYCPYLTPDSKYFFYSSNYDVKWIAAGHLPFKVGNAD